jgi:hypothetical protein
VKTEAARGDPAVTSVLARAFVGAVVGDVPDTVTEEPYAEDGYTGSRYVFDDEPVATLATISDGDLQVTRAGDEYVVSGVLIISDGGSPFSLLTFPVLVLGGPVTYIVGRRQRTQQAGQKQA